MPLRDLLRSIRTAKLAARKSARLEDQAGSIDRFIVYLFEKVFQHPIFALILALVLVVLALAATHNLVSIAMALAWLLTFVWLVRAEELKRHGTKVRLAGICIGMLLSATAYWALSKWALKQYDDQHAGKIHILRFTPFPLRSGDTAKVNCYYENTGDDEVVYQAMTQGLIIKGLSGHSDDDLKISVDSVYKSLKDAEIRTDAHTLYLSPHGSGWETIPSQGPIDQASIDAIESGDSTLLTMGVMRYVKPVHKDVTFCILWGKSDGVVMQCPGHNNE